VIDMQPSDGKYDKLKRNHIINQSLRKKVGAERITDPSIPHSAFKFYKPFHSGAKKGKDWINTKHPHR